MSAAPVTAVRGLHYRHWCHQLPAYVYALYSGTGRLLYIGLTNNVETRIRQHAGEKPWWPSVAEVEVSVACCIEVGAANEKHLIKALQPVHNVDLSVAGRRAWATRRARAREQAISARLALAASPP